MTRCLVPRGCGGFFDFLSWKLALGALLGVSLSEGALLQEEFVGSFTDFVAEVEPRLQCALLPVVGLEAAREATAEALAYGWEHWDRIRPMENPSGYLYRVARNKARRFSLRRVMLPEVPSAEMPWIEPGLPAALSRLSEKQRTVVLLVYAFGWRQSEVADLLGLGHGAVQKHAERGLAKLRSAFGGVR